MNEVYADFIRALQSVKGPAKNHIIRSFKQKLMADIVDGADVRKEFRGGEMEKALNALGFSNEDINQISTSTNEINEYVEIYKNNDIIYITGKPGAGKSYLAEAIHNRANPGTPFIKINAGTLQEGFHGAELFGVEKGAYTGADTSRNGAFIEAGNGTLFIDELQSLEPGVQKMLNTAIDEKQITKVTAGHSQSTKTPYKCKVIVASNENLKDMVKAGKFRGDLFSRLIGPSTYHIDIPSLNSDPDQVMKIVNYELDNIDPDMKIDADALEILKDLDYEYEWRELKAVIQNAYKRAKETKSSIIRPEHLSGEKETIQKKAGDISKKMPGYDKETAKHLANQPDPSKHTLNRVQKDRICKVFGDIGGDVSSLSSWLLRGNLGLVTTNLNDPQSLNKESIINAFRAILDEHQMPNATDEEIKNGIMEIITIKESKDEFEQLIPEDPEEIELDGRVLESLEVNLIADKDILGISSNL